MKNLKVSVLAVVLLFCIPIHAFAIDIQFEFVDTSVGVGTVWINGVSDHDSLAVGTLLSSELAQLIESDPVFGDPRMAQLEETFGPLTNLEFLTSALTPFGNAGQQIEDEFTAFFNIFDASAGGTATLLISNVFLGSESYSLFGGPLNENTVVLGQADVDFYEVIAHITLPNDSMQPIPEPGTLLLLGSGMVGIYLFRNRKKLN